ncbi:hypothetical protein KSS87_019448 [Heliosperma pusillum]|nr:hypothetical protein KSS87_019448 [Heliosperma pusillum]
MECNLPLHHQKQLIPPPNLMIINPFLSISTKHHLKPKTLFSKSLPFFCTISKQLENPSEVLIQLPNGKPSINSKDKIQIIKEKWLFSLSNNGLKNSKNEDDGDNVGLKWVIGIDPDLSGALAVLKSDVSGIISAEVFDSPIVQVAVGNRLRKRLDARSIVQLLQSFDAPTGTIAYLEQSTPFPQDGKQGWWSGGFGYGLWIGILVASGFSVVPVPSNVWKKELELARGQTSKDESRELATQLFPCLSTMLKRKKDHGRAEALLIAAYGNGHKIKTDIVLKLDQQSCETASVIEINESEMDHIRYAVEQQQPIPPSSPFQAPKHCVNPTVFKDFEAHLYAKFSHQDDGNWWLSIFAAGDKIPIGYWPKSLFSTSLTEVASQVEWGGEIDNPGTEHPQPDMGSGRMADYNTKISAFFQKVTIVNEGLQIVDPSDTEKYEDCIPFTTLDEGNQVPKFDGKSSFTLWQRRMKDLLVHLGLAKALKEDDGKTEKMSDDYWEEVCTKCASTIRFYLYLLCPPTKREEDIEVSERGIEDATDAEVRVEVVGEVVNVKDLKVTRVRKWLNNFDRIVGQSGGNIA